jgi:hypothetical protein
VPANAFWQHSNEGWQKLYLLEAVIGPNVVKVGFVRIADLNISIMLRQRINVCFGEAAPQHAGPMLTVVLGRSCDFAKYTICAKLPWIRMTSNGRSQPKGDIAICHIGGEQSFAASARSKERREESGRSGHQPVFSVVQTRRMAAVSPTLPLAAQCRVTG